MFFSGCFKKPGLSRIYRLRKPGFQILRKIFLSFIAYISLLCTQEEFHDFPNSSIVSSGQSTHKELLILLFYLFILAVWIFSCCVGFSGGGEHWLLSLWRARPTGWLLFAEHGLFAPGAPEARLPALGHRLAVVARASCSRTCGSS